MRPPRRSSRRTSAGARRWPTSWRLGGDPGRTARWVSARSRPSRSAAERVEIDEFPLPDPDDTSGLLRVEACGVRERHQEVQRDVDAPTILGHESVGRIERVGETAARRWGVEEGDRVLLEEYLPCGHCAECRSGEFRSCSQTDNHGPTAAIRYGSTPVQVPRAVGRLQRIPVPAPDLGDPQGARPRAVTPCRVRPPAQQRDPVDAARRAWGWATWW